MDLKLACWIAALVLGAGYWLYADYAFRAPMNYPMHEKLFDKQTGAFKRALDIMNITEVLLVPESYVNKTNPIERLNHLIQAVNFETAHIMDQQYSDPGRIQQAAGPHVNQTLCGLQLDWLLAQLANRSYELLAGRRGLELAQLMDSFGKPDANFYSGLAFWQGSYERCRRLKLRATFPSELRLKTGAEVGASYCIARFRHSAWDTIRELTNPATSIRVGVCLPETCDTSAYPRFKHQIEQLAKLEMDEHFKQVLKMSSFTCLPDERSPMRQIPASGRIYLWIVGSWLTLIISASLLYELYVRPKHLKASLQEQDKQPRENILMENTKTPQLGALVTDPKLASASKKMTLSQSLWVEMVEGLSLRYSLKSFKFNAFRVRHHLGERVRVNLNGLDSIKLTMALLVVLGHSSLINTIYARSLRNKIEMSTGNAGRMAMSVVRCVDTYFVFFGLLTSFTLLRKLRAQQLGNPLFWLAINAGIFVRVGPIFMLAYWFSRSLMPYLGSGPWWDYGSVDALSMKSLCINEPWYKSVPYFGHLGIPQVPACLLPGWFIVAYVQLSLLMPLLTYVLINLRSQTKRLLLVAFLSLVSCSCLGLRAYFQRAIPPEGFNLYGSMAFNLLEKFEPTGYMTSLSRLGSVAVGSLVGCLLHEYELGQIKEWPRWLTSKLTIGASLVGLVLLVCLPLIGHQMYLATGELPSVESIVFTGSFSSFIFPILIAITAIHAVTVKNRNVIMRLLGHSFWHIFNRLGLLIFLVHFEILMYGATSFEQAPTYGFITDVMKMWAFGSFASILLAFVLYLLVEAPLGRLLVLIAKPWLHNDNSVAKITAQKVDN